MTDEQKSYSKIIERKGFKKYIDRVKGYRLLTKRHSSFYLGLYAQKNFFPQKRSTLLITSCVLPG